MELVRFARYPFLPGVGEAVRQRGPALPDLLGEPRYASVRRRAAERVEAALGSAPSSGQAAPAEAAPARWDSTAFDEAALGELLSMAVARMLVACVGDRTLARRWAEAEAHAVGERLAAEDPESDTLDEAATALGLPLVHPKREAVILAQAASLFGDGGFDAGALGVGAFAAGNFDVGAGNVPHGRGRRGGQGARRIHFTDYLRSAPSHERGWKLVERTVDRGHVTLDAADVARLCRESYARRLEREMEAELARATGDLRQALAPLLADLAPKVEAARARWGAGDFGPMRTDLFPPCMTHLYNEMKAGKQVTHHARFAMASFLHTIGLTTEQILDYYTGLPNFDREKSRYQIEHITGAKSVEAYTPPSCATMQTYGICPLEQRDAICFTVKHPLSYYRRRIRAAGPQPSTGSPTAAQSDITVTQPSARSPAGEAKPP